MGGRGATSRSNPTRAKGDKPLTDTKIETRLPHWDMTPAFPALDSQEFVNAFALLVRSIDDVVAFFEEKEIRKTDGAAVDDATVSTFEDAINRLNDIAEQARTIRGFLYAFVTTEAQNDLAQNRMSEMQMHSVPLDKLEKRLTAWIGSLDVDELVERSQVAKDHEFFVRRAHTSAQRQMSEIEEDLAASLNPSGKGSWSKLHGNVTSRVMVDVPMPDGTTERVPMAAIPGFMESPDPAAREAAFRAALETWPSVEVPLAAALNSIKGWQNEVDKRRGWPDSLEPALFANNVDRATLDAMQTACTEAFPDLRRFLTAKARIFGKERLSWWDVPAPVTGAGKHWEWDETASFIVRQFQTFSDKLADLAARAFLERWIDAEPREGKRGGGFCMGLQRDESRILVNFTNTFQAVTTVAHELGHAYHNLNLTERTPIQRRTPMALAETASTFCETIVTNALLDGASPDERLEILNGDLVGAFNIIVIIHARFLFEKGVYEGREKRELTPSELCKLIADAQAEVLGDAIDANGLHPYAWAVSPHYYSSAYYNWPYTFGLLFGLGLYKQYEKDPEAFRASYDELLASTGMGDAATLCARFGIDVRTPDFWRSSLDVVKERIAEFEKLAG
jgi:oligoendopeptidase F